MMECPGDAQRKRGPTTRKRLLTKRHKAHRSSGLMGSEGPGCVLSGSTPNTYPHGGMDIHIHGRANSNGYRVPKGRRAGWLRWKSLEGDQEAGGRDNGAARALSPALPSRPCSPTGTRVR